MQNLRGISSIEEVAVGVNEDNFNEVGRDSVRMSVTGFTGGSSRLVVSENVTLL